MQSCTSAATRWRPSPPPRRPLEATGVASWSLRDARAAEALPAVGPGAHLTSLRVEPRHVGRAVGLLGDDGRVVADATGCGVRVVARAAIARIRVVPRGCRSADDQRPGRECDYRSHGGECRACILHATFSVGPIP